MSERKFLGSISRRRFLAGAAGVLGATSMVRGFDRTGAKPRISDGLVVAVGLDRCAPCGRLSGYVVERYNGGISVLCRCERPSNGVTSMSSTRDDELVWTPTTHHKGPDGRLWHTPYFAGMRLSWR